MVDDSSKRARSEQDGGLPEGDGAHREPTDLPKDTESLYRLLEARLGLGDIRAAHSVADPQEMTPTPMVVGSHRENLTAAKIQPMALPHRVEQQFASPNSDGNRPVRDMSAPGSDAGSKPTGSECEDELDSAESGDSTQLPRYSSYHPPRTPPSSMVPPRAPESFSVAPEYDPRAPTKPRVRRNTSAPPPPLLFGLDRMLVWGLVLGGLFVAAIVITVHQFALTSYARPGKSVAGRGNAITLQEESNAGTLSSAPTPAPEYHGVAAPGLDLENRASPVSGGEPPAIRMPAATGSTDRLGIDKRELSHKALGSARMKSKAAPPSTRNPAVPKGPDPWIN